MANIYSIGKSALMAANYAISVTGHNISNAGVEGYNRQVVLQSNTQGQRYGFGHLGAGTQLDDVRRVYDQFIAAQYINTQSDYSKLSTYHNQISRINNKLADDSAGISPALQGFFSSVQDIASSPTSSATREAMLSEAQMLVGRYNSLASQLNDQRDASNAQIINSVELINTYAGEIAKLNEQISRAQQTTGGAAPNDLLDQRDLLISKLSQEVGVRIVENGVNLDVYVGNGQPLVISNTSFSMFARYSQTDPKTVEIGYVNNGREVVIPSKLISGGNISGYMEFIENELDPVANELGRIAATLATDFNTQHKLGMDLNGDMGQDFFSFVSTTSRGTASGGGVTARITDTSKLYASNYEVGFNGSEYTIKRQSDGTSFTFNSTLDDGSTWDGVTFPVTIDGITFDIPAGFAANESVVIKPLNNVAASLTLAISDSNKIAAASPVRTGAGDNNLGTGSISLGTVTGSGFATSGTLTFDGATGTFTSTAAVWVTTPGGTPALYPAGTGIPYQEGTSYDFGDFNFTITGDPQDGDTFFIEPNTGGTGDNRNMLALAALQDAKTMLNGTTTYQGAYSQLVNRIGAKTRELEITSTSTGNLLTGIYEEQQSQSGVNLDEEAVNLMRYQQNYNAASKMIQTANEMFDAILAIF